MSEREKPKPPEEWTPEETLEFLQWIIDQQKRVAELEALWRIAMRLWVRSSQKDYGRNMSNRLVKLFIAASAVLVLVLLWWLFVAGVGD